MILKLHRRAEEELRDAALWYASQETGLGHRFLQAIGEAFELLEKQPQQFAKLETASDREPFHRVLVEAFPYIVVYETLGNDVFVYAVAHASRRPNYWRRRKRDVS